MSEVSNSHYVSRTTTKPWETASRHLHYFDLATSTLGREPSLTLFAKPGLHTTATERKLHRSIEDSLGKYKQRAAKSPNGVVSKDEIDPRETRALIGLVALQSARAREALGSTPPKYRLDDMLAQEGALDWLINQFATDFHLLVGTLPGGDWLAYPSVGYFVIPVMDQLPAMAVPISPRTFVTLYPRGAIIESGIADMVRTPKMISTFSMIGGGLEHKIVIPALIAERNEERALIAMMVELRALGRQLFNAIGRAAVITGLRGYGYDERETLGELPPVQR